MEQGRQEGFSDSDWGLPGPRTSGWCISYIGDEDQGIEGHHDRWRTNSRLRDGEWGVQEHVKRCKQVKQALCIDQFDGTNSVSIEAKFRRLQTIEYGHGDNNREADSRAVGGRLSLEEQCFFAGTTSAFTRIMVCPALILFVKDEVDKEARLAKNPRLARDERDQAGKGKNKKKQDGE